MWLTGNAVTPKATAGEPAVSGWFGDLISHWVLLPENGITIGNYAFVALVFALLGLTLVKDDRLQAYLSIPVLYLAAFVWENRLIVEPTTTRLILFGALLVMMMGTDHPPTQDDSVPLGWFRTALGYLSLLIPVFCFAPNLVR